MGEGTIVEGAASAEQIIDTDRQYWKNRATALEAEVANAVAALARIEQRLVDAEAEARKLEEKLEVAALEVRDARRGRSEAMQARVATHRIASRAYGPIERSRNAAIEANVILNGLVRAAKPSMEAQQQTPTLKEWLSTARAMIEVDSICPFQVGQRVRWTGTWALTAAEAAKDMPSQPIGTVVLRKGGRIGVNWDDGGKDETTEPGGPPRWWWRKVEAIAAEDTVVRRPEGEQLLIESLLVERDANAVAFTRLATAVGGRMSVDGAVTDAEGLRHVLRAARAYRSAVETAFPVFGGEKHAAKLEAARALDEALATAGETL